MKNLFEKAKDLTNEGQYKKLLTLISEMNSHNCLHPELLVLKSHCIQTTKDAISAGLEDVQKSLEDAIALDETYFPAFVELAYFKLNVMDDAEAAVLLFDKAIEIINRIATEAILGKASCLAELKSKEDSLSYIEEAKTNLLEKEKLKKFLDEDLDFYSSN